MGGWMSYQRLRQRNGLMFRKPDEDADPYWHGDLAHNREALKACGPNAVWEWQASMQRGLGILIGDMNRMERDYLNPVYPEPPFASREPRSDPATQCADATGVDLETVRKVMRYVFLEQP